MLYFFPSEFVFWADAKNHAAIKQDLMPKIELSLPTTKGAQIGKWNCDVNTEFFSSGHTAKYADLITTAIYPALDEMLEEITKVAPSFVSPKHSKVEQIWYNHYENGGTQEVHSHGTKFDFSGVYILDMQEENKTVFFSHLMASLGKRDSFQAKEAREGSIIIFPSHMLHYVLPCEKPRTTIAFNLSCQF